MAVTVGNIRYWLLKKFGSLFSRLEGKKNWPAKELYKITRCLWEAISHSKVYHIVSGVEYLSTHPGSLITLKANRTGYATNAVVIGKNAKQMLDQVPLPDMQLFCFSDVCVRYGSDFILNPQEHLAINDYCATIDDSNKTYVDESIYLFDGKVVITKKWEVHTKIESGIMLVGKFSFNYYHNIFENLIKLLVIEEINERIPDDVPVIVDEAIINVPNFKRIYDVLSTHIRRKMVIVHKNELVDIQKLYYISSINYIVPEHKDFLKGSYVDYIFDKEYTLKLRNKLLPFASKENYPKRIFITRKNTKHRNFNEEELFAILEPLGFKKIAPEEFSIEEQIGLFNGADWIIGGSGAAFTNLLFCSPGCKIVCLFRNSQYIAPVFSTIACFNDADLMYFTSSNTEKPNILHSDFVIEKMRFQQFVDDCIAPTITD